MDACETIPGSVEDVAAVAECVAGSDAAVYLIGILGEDQTCGVTFEGLQRKGVERAIADARAAGIRRFLLMRANGVKPEGRSYQLTKFQAEEALKASGLD